MLRGLAVAALVALAPAARAQSQPAVPPVATDPVADAEFAKQQVQLDAIKRELDQIEQSLNDPKLDDARLIALRDRLDPAAAQLAVFIAAATPRVDELNKRLAQLAPKPDGKEATPETADMTRMREAAAGARDAAVALLNTANALQVQAGQLATRIADRRRANLAEKILERSPSIVAPSLLASFGAALPSTAAALWRTAASWAGSIPGRLTEETGLALAIATLFALLAAGPGRGFACRFIRRAEAKREPTPLGVALGAAGVAAAGVALPLIAASALSNTIDGIDLFPPRLLPLVRAIIYMPAWILAGRAIVHALLAPGVTRLHLLPVSDDGAAAMLRLVTAAVGTMGTASILEAAAQSVASPISISVAIKGLAALLLSGLLLTTLRRASQASAEARAACLGPYVDPGGRIGAVGRIVGWALVLALAAAPLFGYIALAWFLAQQMLWAGALFAMTTIALAVIDALAGQMRREDTATARFAHLQMGLPQRALEQAGALIGGVLKAAILVIAVILLLAPWGLESGSLFDAFQAVIFGFSVAGVTISLSSLLVAAALFAAGVFVTRLVQGWLETDFLPTTGVDAGLRNSIRTGVGYLGSFAAAGLALSTLGVSVDKLAIVAGALSVGIGFGLQSIVNNFVSGLILLWERPIRVGDWVVVGDEQGIVRRINVRATEIETFDRTAIVVPNSTFISGIVKNKVLSDRSGRVALTVTVNVNEDAEVVRHVLASCLREHREVMREPPPTVLLRNFGAGGLDFDLYAFVADVSSVARVGSELRFFLLKRLREEEIAHPAAPGTPVPLNTQQLETAFANLARSIEEGRLEAAPSPPAKPASERR